MKHDSEKTRGADQAASGGQPRSRLPREAKSDPPSTRGAAADTPQSPVPAEERHRMIAVAAYYLAERRGFAPGGEMEDWRAAEAEIDRYLIRR